MSFIQAIETKYSGVLFRSRLEARWAVFYDSLNLKWSYELEGFKLKSGLYLPDFLLPELDAWVEIKGKDPTDEECDLCQDLATSTKKSCFIFYGNIPEVDKDLSRDSSDSAFAFQASGGMDSQYWWCECPTCGKLGIQFNGRADRIPCGCKKSGDKRYNFDSTKLKTAYERARSARFEFR